ncbi:ribonuclease III domain-containing protein [Phaeosphaeriaceae sp. PMI808]|nr:ribonuclease III domain-containing protein [Phaeosphaeriaceae sp. PMI808]
MSSHKRGNTHNHYGDRNQHSHKKQRPNSQGRNQTFNSLQFGDHGHDQAHAAPKLSELSAAGMQTGLSALLDRFIAAETTPTANKDILYHARELRTLLSLHASNSVSAKAKRDLDQIRPDKAAKVNVPDYIQRKVVVAKDLPPLPPIAEPHLHQAVFTHQSMLDTTTSRQQNIQGIDLSLDYERLEFLGDAYIELIASRALYNRFPLLDVPQLCYWRERLVENVALGKFSEAYGFPDRLQFKGQFDKDAKAWKKVVADIFEAYVAGIVLSDPENGFDTAEKWLDELWAPQLLGFKEKVVENTRARDDLQKLIFVTKIELKYREERPMIMENGAQKFFIGVYLTGWGFENEWLGSGEGQSKAQACIAAATDAIKRNSPILQDAAKQKAALMVTRAKERAEKAQAEAAENGQGKCNASLENPPSTPALKEDVDAGGTSKKRKGDSPEVSSEKQSKKHNKDKKRKKEKA